MKDSKKWAQDILGLAGIELNGPHPWDMQVHDECMFDRVFREGSLGLGEAYMDGWWDAEALDEFIARVLSADLYKKLHANLPLILHAIKLHLTNLQSAKRAFIVGEKHYDIGNDLYTHAR